MTKLGQGFEQFKNLGECIESVKQLACHYPGNGPAYYDVTGTPAESLFGVKGQMYNGCEYDFTGWGPDRATPWGLLPNRIIAIRSDLAKLLCGTSSTVKSPQQDVPKRKPLIGPDWKPAPGFERPW